MIFFGLFLIFIGYLGYLIGKYDLAGKFVNNIFLVSFFSFIMPICLLTGLMCVIIFINAVINPEKKYDYIAEIENCLKRNDYKNELYDTKKRIRT